MKWAKLGHHVKLVSATNGDIGHWQIGGRSARAAQKERSAAVAQKLGVTNEVLDIHDGEIMPTLENRRMITRLIRQWNADVVITNRPNDYHPDHRYTSILVQDSAYMVGVPFFTPDVPPLKRNPVFLYTSDRFQRPNPFRADVAVGIDEVIEPTLDALLLMESQIHEGGADGNAGLFPADETGRQRRREEVRRTLAGRYAAQANSYRDDPGEILWSGEGEGHPLRTGIRDLRVRTSTVAGRPETDVPVLNFSAPARWHRTLRAGELRIWCTLPRRSTARPG